MIQRATMSAAEATTGACGGGGAAPVLAMRRHLGGDFGEAVVSVACAGRVQAWGTNDGGALTTSNFGVIQMCTKDTKRNELVYVLIHELTHVFLKSDLHDETFDRAFADLLDVAVKEGLYARKAYTKASPGVFCGKEFY